MVQPLRDGSKNSQIGRTLQIQNPARLFGLIVMLEADLPQRLKNLPATVINAMWSPEKGHNYIAVRRFI
jgi:hypothetical protein